LLQPVCLSVLAGSIVGQKQYQRQGIQNTGYLSRGRNRSAVTKPPSAIFKWFEVFKDEELQKLIRTADNPEITI